jgi:hypothetical protein
MELFAKPQVVRIGGHRGGLAKRHIYTCTSLRFLELIIITIEGSSLTLEYKRVVVIELVKGINSSNSLEYIMFQRVAARLEDVQSAHCI